MDSIMERIVPYLKQCSMQKNNHEFFWVYQISSVALYISIIYFIYIIYLISFFATTWAQNTNASAPSA